MQRFLLRLLACVTLIICTLVSINSYASWFGSSDTITVPELNNTNGKAPAVKNAATIRVTKYVDSRSGLQAGNIGASSTRIIGMTGKNLALDQDVSDLVTLAVKKRFADAGYKLVEDSSALYELDGVVKELTYDVKARDEISISIETTLKEVATGKLVWSGVVVEKDNRFAGVSGNDKKDIALYLQQKLGVVTKKTFDAANGSLIAAHPDLFNFSPGTIPIPGVTALFTPDKNQSASNVIPVTSVMNPPKTGTLVLTTKPARAKVYLEGVYFGMSPLNVEVEVGLHHVEVRHEGYKTATEKVSIRKDDKTELELVLEKP